MAILTPGQNFDHLCDPISGYRGMHDLQIHGSPADLVNLPFFKGGLLSLNASNQLTPGLSSLRAMPLFALNGTNEFDVVSDEGNISGGTVGAYTGMSSVELVTTEFDPTATYAPNSLLVDYLNHGWSAPDGLPAKAWVTVVAPAGGGEVPVGENIAGVVSQVNLASGAQGINVEVYNQPVIRFWPVYCPARA
ncbi:MAG TPA: hypothetical protein VM537_19275 [Anaerolineae bacterium]|nr:hypothetical protein [Anaerolineae bacterium]